MEIVYRAFDGTIFEDEDECSRYEDSLVIRNVSALYMVTEGGGVRRKGQITNASTLSDIMAVAKEATLIYFPTFAARDAFCMICDSRDITADSSSMSTGWNYYSDDIGEWVPLTSIDNLDYDMQDDKMFECITEWCDDLYNEYAKEGKI